MTRLVRMVCCASLVIGALTAQPAGADSAPAPDEQAAAKARAKDLCEKGVMSAAECVGILGPSAKPAEAMVLPGFGNDGTMLPLNVDQLDPSERKTFAALPVASDDARQFLYTRGYLRFCKLVVAGSLPPLQMPPLPARKNWGRKFLTDDEATNVLDVALSKRLAAKLPSQPAASPPIDSALAASNALPQIDADGRSAPLSKEQLTVDEQATFAGLTPDGAEAKKFLYVRGYLRYCRLVVTKTIAPLQLPKLPAPENWNRQHLSEIEARDVLDVALAMKLSAMMAPSPAQ